MRLRSRLNHNQYGVGKVYANASTEVNMKKFIGLLVVLGVMASANLANAVPLLQVYVEGATYDASTETWVGSGSGPVRLWAIGNVNGSGGKGSILDVHLSVAYDSGDSPTISVTGSTTGGFGGYTDPSNPGNPTQIGGTHVGTLPQLSDGSFLPSHGIYGAGTSWVEYDLGDFTLEDSQIGDFITSFPAASGGLVGQINVYEISVSGTETVHFDLYDHVMAGNHVKVTFAPFSHDGEGNGVPDASSTVTLLGLALLGLSGIRCRFVRKS